MYKSKQYCFAVCVFLLITQLPGCTTLKQKAQTFITPSTPMSFEDAQDFERRHLMLAQKLIEKNEWRKAEDVYNEALKRLPHSEAIQNSLKKMYQKNSEYIEKLIQKLTISRGLWLDKNQHLYEALAKAEIRGKKAQYKNRAIKSEVKLISKQLTNYGNQAIAENQARNAEYLLNLAEQLKETKQNKEASKEAKVQKTTESTQKKKVNSPQTRSEKLITSYKQAYKNNKLQLAYQFINQAAKLNPNNREIKIKKLRLAEEIEEKVQLLLSSGRQLYTAGNYEKALESWKKTLKLDSRNQEALNNIERTEKILINLSRIKKKQEKPTE